MGEIAVASRTPDPLVVHAAVIERSARAGAWTLDARGLLPMAACEAVIAAAVRRLAEPAARPTEVVEMIDTLLGAWPTARPHDPDTYARLLADVLSGYSTRVGLAAVRTVIRSKTFLPVPAELVEVCDSELGRIKVARLMALSHQRRREELRRDATPAGSDITSDQRIDIATRLAELSRRLSGDEADTPARRNSARHPADSPHGSEAAR